MEFDSIIDDDDDDDDDDEVAAVCEVAADEGWSLILSSCSHWLDWGMIVTSTGLKSIEMEVMNYTKT